MYNKYLAIVFKSSHQLIDNMQLSTHSVFVQYQVKATELQLDRLNTPKEVLNCLGPDQLYSHALFL